MSRECVFFGHGNKQNGVGGWKENHGMRYHLYLFSEDVELKFAVAFAYGDSMQRGVQNKREDLLGDMDFLYLPDEKERADTDVSKNMSSVEMTGERDENSAMELWTKYWIGAPIEKD